MISIPLKRAVGLFVVVILLFVAGLSWQINRSINAIVTSIEEIDDLLPILEKLLEERRKLLEGKNR